MLVLAIYLIVYNYYLTFTEAKNKIILNIYKMEILTLNKVAMLTNVSYILQNQD